MEKIKASSLTYIVQFTPLEFDTILSLLIEKYNQLQKLPLKRRKQLNVLYGVNYVNEYENCLYNLKTKLEKMRYEE